MKNETPQSKKLEMTLSWLFRGLALGLMIKAAYAGTADGLRIFLFWLAASAFFFGASFDAASVFRVLVLGRVDYANGKKGLDFRARIIFSLAAIILLIAWLSK
ncbi:MULTISPECIES: hypothetical protein [unclassified Rhizobacter]|uniref:hypothetical protein n=1 Tax=unclassified Rhizobacter TaxID=2640088 RepID=UPI000B0B0F19|nr:MULTISPECIES: hypothetical protein [unclassified Rhizobacter]